ncbi:hypothetical protein [Aquabacterium sp.]|uniref:hypothetical protein n=1 Tax=Aquabacterium sp. TaxID=1872578 RepID=UPI0035AD7812
MVSQSSNFWVRFVYSGLPGFCVSGCIFKAGLMPMIFFGYSIAVSGYEIILDGFGEDGIILI